MDKLFHFGWYDLTFENAADLGLDAVESRGWQGFHVGLFGVGLILMIRPRP